MEAVDYVFYIEEFGGSMSEEDFFSVIVEATAFVDSLVVDDSNLQYECIQRKYKNAICSIADEIIANNSNIKRSESVGNHSVSYLVTSPSEAEAAKTNKALMFLRNTGLLSCPMR